MALLGAILTACSAGRQAPTAFPAYDPFIPLGSGTVGAAEQVEPVAVHRGPTPTRVPLRVPVPAEGRFGGVRATPTPDLPRVVPTLRQETEQYVVQPGDTLGLVARRYGVSIDALIRANGLANADVLEASMALTIPPPEAGQGAPALKLIPDSELVNGPAAALFDVAAFVRDSNGYLATYAETVEDEFLTGSQILSRISRNYSVNPRLLLALLEYESRWVTGQEPNLTDYPMGLQDDFRRGLYRQLAWTADTLNRGYYLWRVNGIASWVLADSSSVPVAPTLNAGTAALQNFFAQSRDRAAWDMAVGPEGFISSYTALFGDPFALSIEPLVPSNLELPTLSLPFETGETWYFTGGPHGGWDSGSAWAALDFGPPGDTASCSPSLSWIAAVGDGPVARAGNGAVIQDLDNDGYEETGWVVLYMHVDSGERVEPGTYLFRGDRIGHPSCEGGLSNGTHLHLARRYNGEWITADRPYPFVLDGWVSSGSGIEYDGWLSRGEEEVWAWDGTSYANQIGR